VVALFKPQFEVSRTAVARGGVVRDAQATAGALRDFSDWATRTLGAAVDDPIPARVLGAKGNQEWLVHLTLPEAGG
jgi:23S rRNA (cytidine1920-2'-O)/16S rRNA (cytidine1409-2'-O)-methyltransferase